MTDASYRHAVDDVGSALDTLIAATASASASYAVATRREADREAILELITGWATHDRRDLEDAMSVLKAALKKLRSNAIRVLVDKEHMTITELGTRMGISRQAVSSLYQSARDGMLTEQPDRLS